MGYVIRSEDRGGRYPTWYVLESEPLELKCLTDAADWYERQTRKARPRATGDLPLFAEGE